MVPAAKCAECSYDTHGRFELTEELLVRLLNRLPNGSKS